MLDLGIPSLHYILEAIFVLRYKRQTLKRFIVLNISNEYKKLSKSSINFRSVLVFEARFQLKNYYLYELFIFLV